MQLGVIGLGRMGANIVRRLTRAGHACVVYDRDPAPGKALEAEGATAVDSLTARRPRPRSNCCGRCSSEAIASSTAAIRTGATTSGAASRSPPTESTTWTSASAAACGA